MSSELQNLINQSGTLTLDVAKPEPSIVKPADLKIEPATDSDSGGNVDVKAKKVSWFKKLYEEKMSERLIACKDSKTQQHAIWEYAFEMISKFAVSAFKASVWSGAITAIALALIASDQFGILLGLLQIK